MKNLLCISISALATISLLGQRPADISLPNDLHNYKTAEPAGTGDGHFIEREKDITYTIYFRNEGADTAQNIRIVDTLSTYFDINSLREEGASHAYNMSIQNGNVVRFSFPNIRLPNSSVNEVASQGFVSYTVSQKENLPLMTRITNKAYIYFDFRPAVITNTVYHTIIENTTDTKYIFIPDLSVGFFPNPMDEQAIIDLQGVLFQEGELQVFDYSGRLRQSMNFHNQRFSFFPDQLPSGPFFYKILLDGQLAATGNFVVK